MKAQQKIVLGRISGLFGIQGWVKIYSYTRPLESILDHDVWWIGSTSSWQRHQLLDGRTQGKTLVARLADEAGRPLVDRDAAQALYGLDISVPRDHLPEPPPGQHYWVDLIGLTVRTLDGVELGQVSAMMETGANDVLVVTGQRERLIPLVADEFVIQVEPAAGFMVVDWDPDF